MKKIEIGELKKVELREIWPHEAKNFTNWLSNNLHILGEAIGLELNEPETERSLDDSNFKVDIMAKTKKEIVVIENQLEQTDNKHLGQIITYMIMKKAKIAIWIAKEVREEHIKVINSLNEELTDKSFYLVQLESYQIDESKPAPFLKVVCRPSEEIRKAFQKNKEESEVNKLKNDFWTSLLDRSSKKQSFFLLKSIIQQIGQLSRIK